MGSLPFIQFYPSDWKGGVAKLSDLEEHVYFKVCMEIWDSGNPVHVDDVPRLFKTPSKDIPAAIANLVRLKKLKKSRSKMLTNGRASDAHKTARKRLSDAKKAAKSRWGGNATAKQGHMRSHYEGNANQSQNQKERRGGGSTYPAREGGAVTDDRDLKRAMQLKDAGEFTDLGSALAHVRKTLKTELDQLREEAE